MIHKERFLKLVYPDHTFKLFETYLISDKGLILNKHYKVITAKIPIIKGNRYRRTQLMTAVWGKENDKPKNKPTRKELKKEFTKKVRSLTELQNLDVLKDYDKRDFKKYHLDHIIPISKAFSLGMSIEETANINNLQMLPSLENTQKKGNKMYCVISQCQHIKDLYHTNREK